MIDSVNVGTILAISEGAKPVGGTPIYSRNGNEIYVPRLGGISQNVGKYIENHGFETRVTILGHLQRGCTPTAFERWLATPYGAAAVRLAAQGKFDRMVALRSSRIVDISLQEALAIPKGMEFNGDAVITAAAWEFHSGIIV